jgi:Ca-activated chloride channel homolog
MAFIQPLAFLLLGLIPVVIAMYLLKLRRTEQDVPSVYLWRRMVRDLEANAPWQRLRRNLLLLLQVLFLLFLIVGLARPFFWSAGSGSQALILILDVSASMAATDAAPNRLEAAKIQARRVVDDMPDGTRVTVISAGEGAQVLASSSEDRRAVYQALDSITVQPGGSNLADALELASAIAARQPDTEIVVLSDGKVNLPERIALQGNLRYLPVGTGGFNQAVSLLTVEDSPSGEGVTAFAQVSDFNPPGGEPVFRRLVFSADGQTIQAFDLEIPAGGQQAVLAEGLPETVQVVEAALSGDDLLALDDRAWAVYRPAEAVTVEVVTQGNRFLETALRLLPGVEPVTILPADWEALVEQAPPELTIFDTYVPLTRTLPTSSLLFIGPLRSSELFTVTGTLEAPRMAVENPGDAVLENLAGLDAIQILDASRVSVPDWARVLLADANSGEALLMRGETGGKRAAVLGFDLRRSDLPLQVAFPVLLANLMGWLAPPAMDLPAQLQPGEATSFALPANTTEASLQKPDGEVVPVERQDGRLLIPAADQLGLYQVRWGEGETARYAVNLFSPQESDIEPAGQLAVSGLEASGEAEGQQQAQREWWRPLIWLALVFIMLEWLVYQRANLKRIWDRLSRRALPGADSRNSPPNRSTYR